jgi:hypothetical protein
MLVQRGGRDGAASVELSRNARGVTQITVKASAPDVAEAKRLAQDAYDLLRDAYPHAGEPNNGTPFDE